MGTGGLGQLSPRLMHEPMLTNAGYGMGKPADEHAKAWEDFSDEEFVAFLEHQSMHFVVNTIVSLTGHLSVCSPTNHGVRYQPFGNYTPDCPQAERRCYGSCFVNALDEYSLSQMRMLINRTHTLAPDRTVVLYTEFALSTEPNASTLYSDSLWVNASGSQLAYETCAMNNAKTGPGSDYLLFFGNETNSYGKQLEAMMRKVMALGFDGAFHHPTNRSLDPLIFPIGDQEMCLGSRDIP